MNNRYFHIHLQDIHNTDDLLFAFTQMAQHLNVSTTSLPLNIDACIDVFSDVRHTNSVGQQHTSLDNPFKIMLYVHQPESTTEDISQLLMVIVAAINSRYQEMGETPLIYLLLTAEP